MSKLRIATALLCVLVLLLAFANAERLAGQTIWGNRGLAVTLNEWSYTLGVAQEITESYYPWMAAGPHALWTESSGQFTRDRLRDQLRQFDLFYMNTHGLLGVFQTGDHQLVYASDVAQWVDRPFKLVFSDACYHAADTSLAEAFGIHQGDEGRAFFGWVGQSEDSWYFREFTLAVFRRLAQGDTLVNGVLMAVSYWPIEVPWRIYGDIGLKFHPVAAGWPTSTPVWTVVPTASATPTATPSSTATQTPNPAVTLTAVAQSTSTPEPTSSSTPTPAVRSYVPAVGW